MLQGPYSTFYNLIKNALKTKDMPAAIENINYCSPQNAQEIYKLIFEELYNGPFYFLRDIKALKPTLWLAFLKRSELCSEIGTKKLCQIIKKIIPILKKLQDELELDPKLAELISTYSEILRLIATNNDFLHHITEKKHSLSEENKEYILSQLQTMAHIEDEVLFFYEKDETEEELFVPRQDIEEDKNDDDSLEKAEKIQKKRSIFDDLQDPIERRKHPYVEYLKLCFWDDKIKEFIVLNQDDFLFRLDPASLNKYIFTTTIFSDQEKLVILKTFIAGLESDSVNRRERAKNTLSHLLTENKAVRALFSRDLFANLNTQALLLHAVCSVTVLEPQAQSTQKMLETMKACFDPLGRAMKECMAKNKAHVIRDFFRNQRHLDSLCTLYSFCAEQECHQQWDRFWELHNLLGDYQVIFNDCLNQYPVFLHRKALSHLSLGKNDEVNQKLAKGYLKEAIVYQHLPAHLALAAIYAKQHKHKLMIVNFNKFISNQQNNQRCPSKTSSTYRFLFEIYFTCSHYSASACDKLRDDLNGVYPGLVERFEQTMCQALNVKKPIVTGNDLRDPIELLRRRFKMLLLKAPKDVIVEENFAPAPLMLSAEQPVTPFIPENTSNYEKSTTALLMPGSPQGSKKDE